VCSRSVQDGATSDPTDALAFAAEASDLEGVRRAVARGADINARRDQGASVLYGACLAGDVGVVRVLLELGADPNLRAEDPAATIYAETPLDLVLQAQVVSNWEKYTPIYELLVGKGARDSDGLVPDAATNERRRVRALDWQTRRDAADHDGA
jgi:ankyrin repeat protein